MSKGREEERTSVCSRLVNSFDWIALGEWVGRMKLKRLFVEAW